MLCGLNAIIKILTAKANVINVILEVKFLFWMFSSMHSDVVFGSGSLDFVMLLCAQMNEDGFHVIHHNVRQL